MWSNNLPRVPLIGGWFPSTLPPIAGCERCEDRYRGVMLRRWTPWAWALAATTWLAWTLWLREATGGGWVQTAAALVLGLGVIALPVEAARRADRKQRQQSGAPAQK